MDDTEGGRIGADPESQRDARSGEEGRVLCQPSKRVLEIHVHLGRRYQPLRWLTAALLRTQNDLSSCGGLLEGVGDPLEGIYGVDERPGVDATVREQIERGAKRTAA